MKKRAFLFIIMAGILWGSSGLFVNALKPLGLASLQMVAIRATVSALCMAVYALIFDRQCFKANLRQLILYLCSGACIFLTASFYYISMQASSVSTAVVLMYTAPVFVMIYSVLFFGEKFTKPKCVSLVLMIVGCALVSGIVGGLKFNAYGIVTGFLSGITYSAYNIFTKLEMKHKCNPVSASMYSFIFMALIALAVSKPYRIVEVVAEKPSAVLLMIACGVCTCVLPYFLYTLSLKAIAVGTASALGIIEPLSATVFSVVFLKEMLGIDSVIGIVMIVGAVIILSKAEE
ncbi:MAG: EamA family transporter [Clostridia bacterium]|nr:EamA family transporter [Clostridia bacterium]